MGQTLAWFKPRLVPEPLTTDKVGILVEAPSASTLKLADPNEISKVSEWELDFRQLQQGQALTSVSTRVGHFVSLLEIQMPHRVHQIGQAPEDRVTIGILTASKLEVWHGSKMGQNPIVCFGAGCEFEGVSDAGFSALTLSFDADRLLQLARKMGVELPEAVMETGVLVAESNNDRVAAITQLGRSAIMCGWSAPDNLEEDIGEALLKCLTDTEAHNDKSTPRMRATALAKALEYMEAHADSNVPISEICLLSGASWKTLERAFLERFGIGPKAYYRNLRLHRVRADLLRVGPAMLVVDAANRWGFWHMGQFARDYNVLFGELPSETLNLG